MTEAVAMEGLEAFMETVTVYRCKFCDFTANMMQDMASHVKLAHLKPSSQTPGVSLQSSNGTAQSAAMPAVSVQPQSIITTPSLDIPNNQPNSTTQTVATEPQVLLTVDDLSSSVPQNELEKGKPTPTNYEAGNQLVQLNDTSALQHVIVGSMSEPSTGVQMIPVRNVISEEGSTNILEDVQNTTDNQSLGGIQFMKEDDQGQLITANCGHVQLGDGSTVQVLVYDSNIHQPAVADPKPEPVAIINEDVGEAKETAQPIEVQHTSQTEEENQLHFVINAEEDTIYREPEDNTENYTKMESQADEDSEAAVKQEVIEGDEEEEDTASKELYLCGSCSQGFATINECKVHMIQEHGLNDPQGGGRVDAGTQMEPRKKAGRKKKSEQVETNKDEENIALTDSDEDWSERLHSYGSRSKRKRRPPSTLTKDYYLGRSKVKTQRKMQEDIDTSPPPFVRKKGTSKRCNLNGCTARFWDKKTLEHHQQCHLKETTETGDMFKCLECDLTFALWKTARHHMWKAHDIDIDLVTCDICNEFKTDAVFKLKIHRQIHGNDRPYICSVCGKGFKQFAQMRNHEVCHSEISNKTAPDQAEKWHTPKVCDVCGRTFANAKCLKMHVKTVHSKCKQYKCNYCNHTCARKAMLIIHQRIHTGEKPFKCEQCAYSCGDHNSLRRHKMRHTGDKPYKCPHCPYACIQAISLKVHIKNKHPGLGGVYNCHLCLYRTVNKLQYENHMLDHKHGLIETIVNPDGQVQYKNVNHVKRPRVSTMKQEITTVALPDFLESLHTQTVQMQNMLQPQVIQIPVSTTSLPNTEQLDQLEMQVQMNEAGESVISAEDLAKLTNYDGMVHSDVQAAQLIYSALSAISQNGGGQSETATQGVVAGVENGDIQTSIQTDNSEEGVTTHTITFHLPEGEEITENVAIQDIENKNVTILKVNENENDWSENAVMLEQAEVQNS